MTATTATLERLDIGRVIQQLFAVLSRNIVTFAVLALILTGLPTAVLGVLQPNVRAGAGAEGWSWYMTTVLISAVAGLVLQGTLIYATIGDLNGRKVRVSEALAVGLRNFLPLLGVGFLYVLAVMFGSLLLIVPGIMIAIAWIAAVPVLIAEGTSVFASFGRSAELTRGNRWRIFALLLLYLAVYIVLGVVMSIVGGVSGAIASAVSGETSIQTVLLSIIYNVISTLVGATGGAVLYVELRRVREGVGHEALASIFD
jgi:MFS family permease